MQDFFYLRVFLGARITTFRQAHLQLNFASLKELVLVRKQPVKFSKWMLQSQSLINKVVDN